MGTTLCYFSATGNCLAAARELASLTGAEIVSIPEALADPAPIAGADTIGIVFPTYLAPLGGVPLIVERFVRSIPGIDSRRIFAVCTCGGYEIVNAVPALESLARQVRSCGGRLSARHSLRLPMSNLEYDHIPVPIERDSEVIISRSTARLADIGRKIAAGKRGRRQALRTFINALFAPMRWAMRRPVVKLLCGYAHLEPDGSADFRKVIPLTDRSIVVDDTCVKCGICAMVCPVENIEMTDDGPVYHGGCEMCYACDEWCPKGSIHHWSRANGVKYHHPTVKLADVYSPKYR